MATPQNIVLQIAVNGGAPQTGGITASYGASVVASLQDASGVGKARYEIYDYPDGWPCPSGWTATPSGRYFVVTNGSAAPAVTLPAELWGKFLFSVEVNDRKRDGAVANDLFDSRTAVSIPSPVGFVDVAFLEEKQFDSQRGYIGEYKKNLRTIEQVIESIETGAVTQIKSGALYGTANALPAHTRTGNVLTATVNGVLVLSGAGDGGANVTPPIGARILVKNETSNGEHLEHCIYVYSQAGSGGTPWQLTRATDWDAADEFEYLSIVQVGLGTQAGQWRLATQGPYVINTTAIKFERVPEQGKNLEYADGVVTTNVPNPTNANAFTLSQGDHTYALNESVLLSGQTTASERIVYKITATSGATGTLTARGDQYSAGSSVFVKSGQFAGTWNLISVSPLTWDWGTDKQGNSIPVRYASYRGKATGATGLTLADAFLYISDAWNSFPGDCGKLYVEGTDDVATTIQVWPDPQYGLWITDYTGVAGVLPGWLPDKGIVMSSIDRQNIVAHAACTGTTLIRGGRKDSFKFPGIWLFACDRTKVLDGIAVSSNTGDVTGGAGNKINMLQSLDTTFGLGPVAFSGKEREPVRCAERTVINTSAYAKARSLPQGGTFTVNRGDLVVLENQGGATINVQIGVRDGWKFPKSDATGANHPATAAHAGNGIHQATDDNGNGTLTLRKYWAGTKTVETAGSPVSPECRRDGVRFTGTPASAGIIPLVEIETDESRTPSIRYSLDNTTNWAATGVAFNPAGNDLGASGLRFHWALASHTSHVTASALSGTGNGTISAVTVTGTPIAGAWTLELTATAANGGTWTLRDPLNVVISNSLVMTAGAGSATTFEVGGLKFTITDGSTDFGMGATFTLTVGPQYDAGTRYSCNPDSEITQGAIFLVEYGEHNNFHAMGNDPRGALNATSAIYFLESWVSRPYDWQESAGSNAIGPFGVTYKNMAFTVNKHADSGPAVFGGGGGFSRAYDCKFGTSKALGPSQSIRRAGWFARADVGTSFPELRNIWLTACGFYMDLTKTATGWSSIVDGMHHEASEFGEEDMPPMMRIVGDAPSGMAQLNNFKKADGKYGEGMVVIDQRMPADSVKTSNISDGVLGPHADGGGIYWNVVAGQSITPLLQRAYGLTGAGELTGKHHSARRMGGGSYAPYKNLVSQNPTEWVRTSALLVNGLPTNLGLTNGATIQYNGASAKVQFPCDTVDLNPGDVIVAGIWVQSGIAISNFAVIPTETAITFEPPWSNSQRQIKLALPRLGAGEWEFLGDFGIVAASSPAFVGTTIRFEFSPPSSGTPVPMHSPVLYVVPASLAASLKAEAAELACHAGNWSRRAVVGAVNFPRNVPVRFDGLVYHDSETKPTVTAKTAAGTGAAAVVHGSDNLMTVSLTTGAGAAAGEQCHITLTTPLLREPQPIMNPVNSAAGNSAGKHIIEVISADVLAIRALQTPESGSNPEFRISVAASGEAIIKPSRLSKYAWGHWRADVSTDTGTLVLADLSPNGRHIQQATAGNKPTFNAATAALNNRPTWNFDATDDFLQVNATATACKHLHDGTGFLMVLWGANLTADGILFSTMQPATNAHGLRFRPGSNTYQIIIGNGTASPTHSNSYTATGINAGAHMVAVSYWEGQLTEIVLTRNKVTIFNSVSQQAPSSSDPQHSLVFGAALTGGNPATPTAASGMHWAEAILLPHPMQFPANTPYRMPLLTFLTKMFDDWSAPYYGMS